MLDMLEIMICQEEMDVQNNKITKVIITMRKL